MRHLRKYLLALLLEALEGVLGKADGDLLLALEEFFHRLEKYIVREEIQSWMLDAGCWVLGAYLIRKLIQRDTELPSIDDIGLVLGVVEFGLII